MSIHNCGKRIGYGLHIMTLWHALLWQHQEPGGIEFLQIE